MPTLPTRFVSVIVPFATVFRQRRSWRHARTILIGAILASGVRTVASVLRILGLARDRHWVNYHRVLSRVVWSPRAASRILLDLLVRAFVPSGPLVFGIDDTIERRRGRRIRARGVYRDPVHSSRAQLVKTSGLRWLSVMLLARIPWAGRVWALPVLTALAPSERWSREMGRRHKPLTAWARQLLRQTGRWCAQLASVSGRPVIMVGDASFAVFDLLGALAGTMVCITRLRLDARLYAPAPPRVPGTRGRPRVKGERLPPLAARLTDPSTSWEKAVIPGWYGSVDPVETGRSSAGRSSAGRSSAGRGRERGRERGVELATGTALWYASGHPPLPIRWVLVRDPLGRFEPQALLSTDLALSAAEIVGFFVRRWQVEVTFEETRRHLGVETQRQWSDPAIARTTPALLALFSLVTLLTTSLVGADGTLRVRSASWYPKRTPTFSDALAAVRRHWWRARMTSCRSLREDDMTKLPRKVVRRLYEAACYAA